MPDSPDGKKQPEQPPTGGAPTSGTVIPPEVAKLLSTELQFLKVIDVLAKEPFVVLFQEKDIEQARVNVFESVLQTSEKLKQEYEAKQVAISIDEIKASTKEVARNLNAPKSPTKMLNVISLILMIVTFGTFAAFYMLPEYQVALSYILYPTVIAFCMLPTIIKMIYQKKMNQFVQVAKPELESRITKPAENLTTFAQSLIFDLREKFLANNIALQTVRFDLMSNQYQGLKLVQESMAGNRPTYHYELAYPAGMEPLGGKATNPIEDTDTKDEFASFIIKEFEGEEIKEYSFNYIPKEKYEKVNGMLDASDFTESKQANEFMEDINKFNLKCQCGEPLVFKDCQLVNWEKEKEFHFFFATGKKCKCKEVTYIVCADPKDVPAELRDIFI